MFSVGILIANVYYIFDTAKNFPSRIEVLVILSSLLTASAMLQLGWCGYLAKAIGPRADFSRMEFVIPESEFIEEEEEDAQIRCYW